MAPRTPARTPKSASKKQASPPLSPGWALKVPQLKEELRARGLRVGGAKAELVERYEEALAAEDLSSEENDELFEGDDESESEDEIDDAEIAEIEDDAAVLEHEEELAAPAHSGGLIGNIPERVGEWATWSTGSTLLAIATFLYVYFVPERTKAQAVVVALLFSCSEYTWYSVTEHDPEGGEDCLRVRPFSPHRRQGFTSIDQFCVNILFLPLAIVGREAVEQWAISHSNGGNQSLLLAALTVACVAVPTVWLLEILEGYFLIAFMGRNTAWHYTGADAMFHGNIKLSHWKLWFLLGGSLQLAYPNIVNPLVNLLIKPMLPAGGSFHNLIACDMILFHASLFALSPLRIAYPHPYNAQLELQSRKTSLRKGFRSAMIGYKSLE